MMYGYSPTSGGLVGLGMMMLFGLLFLAGLAVLIVWAVRHTGEPRGGGQVQWDNACDIARERYARGEIDRQQYEEMCQTLGVGSRTRPY